MTRPKKQTVEYYPHMVKHGRTLFILQQRYGNDGYAAWFKILETLGETEGHYFNFGTKENWEYLVAKLWVDEDRAKAILKTLADLDAIDKELFQENILWSNNFVSNLERLYARRKTATPSKPIVNGNGNPAERDKGTTETPLSGINDNEKPQSTVKESKEEKNSAEQPLTVPLKDGSEYTFTALEIDRLKTVFVNIDVKQEILKIREWNIDNPKKRKTRRGFPSHVNKWLSGKDEAATNRAVLANMADGIGKGMPTENLKRKEEAARQKIKDQAKGHQTID